MFTRVLALLAEKGLLHGKTLGIDATKLEANAALRSIVRRDDGRGYREYLVKLAKAEGIVEPTREDLARLDRKRPKKGSNEAAGDTKTIEKTLTTADANLAEVRQEGSEAAREQVAERVEEVVADKGYHSNDVLTKLEEVEVRSYTRSPHEAGATGRRRCEKRSIVNARIGPS